jgi:hypothetical protein
MDTTSNKKSRLSFRNAVNVVIATNRFTSQSGNNSSTGTKLPDKGGYNLRESTMKNKINYRDK